MIKNLEKNLEVGMPVVVTYGFNKVLKKPFKFLYEFGYYTKEKAVVYLKGEKNMQDSYAFKLSNLKKATGEDLKKIPWGN